MSWMDQDIDPNTLKDRSSQNDVLQRETFAGVK
jgi:hypothetical protein